MPQAQVVLPVLEQHAEEAAFLWLLRSAAVVAPHYGLTDIAELDMRVEAHLDGLRIGAETGWALCVEQLAAAEPGELFAACVMAFESNQRDRIDVVLDAMAQEPEALPGAVSALGWLPFDWAQPHLRSLIDSDDPLLRRVGLRGAAVHRWWADGAFARELSRSAPAPLAAALRSVGELADATVLAPCREWLSDKDQTLAFWAAWSLAITRQRDGLDALVDIASAGGPFADPAIRLAGRALHPAEALGWQQSLAAGDGTQRHAIELAGAIGDPRLVPWLIEQMTIDELARPAGEAFSTITGIDLAYDDLDRDAPEDFEAGPTEDPEDEDVAMDRDEDLPWPDPDRVEERWGEAGRALIPGQRHLLGQEITAAGVQSALQAGQQRQRAAAAIEAKLLAPEQPLFEVRAPGPRQRWALGAA